MKFMLLYLGDERRLADVPAHEFDRIVGAHLKHAEELRAEGRWVEGNRLERSDAAVRLTIRGPIDGPFAETKEVLAGYDVVECASRADAVACARRRMQLETEALGDLSGLSPALLACAESYAIEVRPLYVW